MGRAEIRCRRGQRILADFSGDATTASRKEHRVAGADDGHGPVEPLRRSWRGVSGALASRSFLLATHAGNSSPRCSGLRVGHVPWAACCVSAAANERRPRSLNDYVACCSRSSTNAAGH